VIDPIATILRQVERRGDAALRALTRRFDGARRASIEVGPAERRRALRRVEPATRVAIRFAARRIAAFARAQKRSLRPFRVSRGGVTVEQRLIPVDTVGVYVPGGRYPLCSTVLMGAIPARVAGCRRVVICTPPRRDGTVAPEILAAAAAAGADAVYAAGGAQAIAAMAFGTRSVPRVDLIVGPGNRHVAAAKTALAGRVGIDFVAGPSELLVIADRSSDPLRIASDLLGQAEHDPDARLWLVALGPGVAGGVRRRLRALLARLPPPNRTAARPAVRRLSVVTCRNARQAAAAANRAAPEHLSVQTGAPRRLLPLLRCYGSLFLGPGSAVALGDYASGPNHILPTAGAARHTGGLSVLRFLKVTTVQEVTRRGLARIGPVVERLAAVEGLEAHRLSVAVRRGGGVPPRAVLFDFDGVLVDSEADHFRAFAAVLAPFGIRLTREIYDRRYLAFDDRRAIREMLADAGPGAAAARMRRGTVAGGARRRPPVPSPEVLVRRKQALFRRLTGGASPLLPGAARLVRTLGRAGAPLAVVSGAARAEVLASLRRGGILDRFATIVTAEDVERSKPDPEGYLLALRHLGCEGGEGCVAIEDSPGGIRAARAAGLRVAGVATSYPPARLRRAGAGVVTRSIASLRPAGLAEALQRPS
jgi:histidinol dehydrogenase